RLLYVALTGPDVVTLLDRQDEHAAISDFPRPRRFNDRLDDVISNVVLNDEFNHDLRKEGDVVFRSAVDSLVTLLPAVPANFRYGHAGDIEFRQSVLYFF